MSKDEKRDRLKSVIDDIMGGKKPVNGEKEAAPGGSQSIINGSDNIQISGNNNTVGRQ